MLDADRTCCEQTAADLGGLQDRLQSSDALPDVLARIGEEARSFCTARHALALQCRPGLLTADGVAVLADDASDALRRRVLASPVPLVSGTPEAQAIRRAEGARVVRPTTTSVLARALGLEDPALAVAAPGRRALALIVVDGCPDAGRDRLALFAHLAGCALDRAVQRARLAELAAEVRHLATSAGALAREALEAPLMLPEDDGNGPVFRRVPAAPATAGDLRDVLTRREAEVLAHLVEGRSNREIAARLHLAPATVKDHVARILAKLGAANRVDAVRISLRLTNDPRHPGDTSPPPGV